MRARAKAYSSGDSKSINSDVIDLSERALALDPQNERAMVDLSGALTDRVTNQWSDAYEAPPRLEPRLRRTVEPRIAEQDRIQGAEDFAAVVGRGGRQSLRPRGSPESWPSNEDDVHGVDLRRRDRPLASGVQRRSDPPARGDRRIDRRGAGIP